MNQKPDHLKVGQWGEEIACRYLQKKGYQVLERNFRNRWGELDIVCRKTETSGLRSDAPEGIVSWFKKIFSRVKKNARGYNQPINEARGLVFVEVKTLKQGTLDPEENMTHSKIKKLIRACEIYLSSHQLDLDSNWQIDVVAITLDQTTHKAQIAHYENAIY